MSKQTPTVVLLGNPNPQMTREIRDEDGNVIGRVQYPAPHLKQSVTRIEIPELHSEDTTELALSTDNDRQLQFVAKSLGAKHRRWALHCHEAEQIMVVHSAGDGAMWVFCPDEPDLEAALAAHFGCARGEPTALVTNGGRDAFHNNLLGTQVAAFNYMAITTDATAASATDTTLASEETTNGLGRATATFAHTGGTNTSTLTKTFTYTGSTSKTLAKIGILNAASSGTLGIETLLSSTATVTTSGDNVTVTETFTA